MLLPACGSPTYLPTYLLTNLPVSLRIQSPRPIDGTHGGTVCAWRCVCIRASRCESTQPRLCAHDARTRHRPLYTPVHGLLTTVRATPLPSRLTNLLRERSRFSLIFRSVRGGRRQGEGEGDITRLERGPGQRSTGTKRSPDGGEQRVWLLPSLLP